MIMRLGIVCMILHLSGLSRNSYKVEIPVLQICKYAFYFFCIISSPLFSSSLFLKLLLFRCLTSWIVLKFPLLKILFFIIFSLSFMVQRLNSISQSSYFFNFRCDIICLMSKICHYKQKSYNYIYICMAFTRGLLRGKGQKYGFMCTPPVDTDPVVTAACLAHLVPSLKKLELSVIIMIFASLVRKMEMTLVISNRI